MMDERKHSSYCSNYTEDGSKNCRAKCPPCCPIATNYFFNPLFVWIWAMINHLLNFAFVYKRSMVNHPLNF